MFKRLQLSETSLKTGVFTAGWKDVADKVFAVLLYLTSKAYFINFENNFLKPVTSEDWIALLLYA